MTNFSQKNNKDFSRFNGLTDCKIDNSFVVCSLLITCNLKNNSRFPTSTALKIQSWIAKILTNKKSEISSVFVRNNSFQGIRYVHLYKDAY